MIVCQLQKAPKWRNVSCKQSKFFPVSVTIFNSVLFDPNEIVEDNSMVAVIVKQNVNLLQRCLKLKNNDIYFAAIDSVINASENFGPALNKHLPVILPLVAQRQDLSNDERILSL